MAFTSRAPRAAGPGRPVATAPTVGPGSYDVSRFKAVAAPTRLSAAPFGSTSARTVASVATVTTKSVGPGSYDIPSTVGVLKPSVAGPSSGFASTLERFNYKTNENPGPASYNSDVSTLRVATKRVARVPVKPQGRLRTVGKNRLSHAPPSIPTAQQSYGYYDAPHGGLVAQPPPPPKPSPYYNPAVKDFTAEARGAVSYARDRSKRVPFTNKAAREVPGPGNYDAGRVGSIGTESLQSRMQRKATASFASTSRRDIVRPNAYEVPGPGQYNSNPSDLIKKSFNVTVG